MKFTSILPSLLLGFAVFTVSCESEKGDIGPDGPQGEQGPVGAEGSAGTNGLNILSLTTKEPAGSNCSSGGIKLQFGLDTNSNNILDTSEITNTDYVCNGLGIDGQDGNDGADGKDGVDGLDGSNGADGKDGVNGQDGSDGVDGTNGVDGKSVLFDTAQEPASNNCEFGGIKINIGTDINGNEVLEDSEITVVDYICNGADGANGGVTFLTLTGDITNEEAALEVEQKAGENTQFIIIENTTNLTSLSLDGVTEVLQLSVVNNESLTALSLPNLKTVIRDLDISDNSNLTSLSLSSLERVTEAFITNNELLEELDFALLYSVNDFYVENNPSLAKVELPELEENLASNSKLNFNNNESLESISINKLVTFGEIGLFQNPNLSAIGLGVLENVESLRIENSPILNTIDLPLLVEAASISIFNNSELLELNFTALERVLNFSISENNALESIDVISLKEAMSFSIARNESLQSIDLSALEKVSSVFLSNTGVDTFELPLLKEIGSLSIIENAALTTVEFPMINTIGANDIEVNIDTGSEFPTSSETSNGIFRISDNEVLESFSLSASSGNEVEIVVERNLSLKSFNMPSIDSIGDLTISSNENLSEINFEALTSLGVSSSFSKINNGLKVNSNPQLTALQFPNLTSIIGTIKISGNSLIATVDFSKLETMTLSESSQDNSILFFGKNLPSSELEAFLITLASFNPPLEGYFFDLDTSGVDRSKVEVLAERNSIIFF